MKKLIQTLAFCLCSTIGWAQTEAKPDSTQSNIKLDEVTITAKRPTTKFTDTGLTYNLQADPAARTMSLFEALRRVPMVTVTAQDEIRVKGSSNYSIYLNGHPYRIAQSDPKTVLHSIPANTIAKVEVITELDGRYDAEAGSAIINIITVKNALDGYSLTLNAQATSRPDGERPVSATNDGINFNATKGKVNMMLGYNYRWLNILNQPMTSDYHFYDTQGANVRNLTTRFLGVDGNHNNHTGRMMLEWKPDSLHSIYTDGHAYFVHDLSDAHYQSIDNGSTSYFRSNTSNTAGTAEANVIYRNYYRDTPDMCRLSIGYRFALNPEKARTDAITSEDEECREGERTLNRVDGHLHEHTLHADYALPLAKGHTLRFGLKEIFRIGKTRPSYSVWDKGEWIATTIGSTEYNGAMNYRQNISALYAVYTGRIQKFSLSASLRGEYSHNSFHLPGNESHTRYHYTDLIPRLSLTYNLSPMQRLTLTYNASVARPGISELDPFINSSNANTQNQGNPDLRQSRTHGMDLSMLSMGESLIMQISASANRETNPIVRAYTSHPETGNVLRSSINFGKQEYLSQDLYIGWDPQSWLSLNLSAGISERWFRDEKLGEKFSGIDWNLYLGADFTLPKSWILGANLMCSTTPIDPWTKYTSTMVMPQLYVNKRFLNGRLTAELSTSSPFAKYGHFSSKVSTKGFTKVQHNDILNRDISLKLTYRLNGGKKAQLKRDTSLRNDDLDTGVH